MEKKLLLAFLVFLSVGIQGYSQPCLTVEDPVFDFGEAIDGTIVEHVFVLKNTGDTVLRIFRIAYNCSCTSYEIPKTVIASGESIPLTVWFDTTGYSVAPQPVCQVLTVYSNDSAGPYRVFIQGRVFSRSGDQSNAKEICTSSNKQVNVGINTSPNQGEECRQTPEKCGEEYISMENAAIYALKAGFPPEEAVTIVSIAWAESGGNILACNQNEDRSWDRGILQINSCSHPEVADDAAFDPQKAFEAAWSIVNKRGFCEWATYQGPSCNNVEKQWCERQGFIFKHEPKYCAFF